MARFTCGFRSALRRNVQRSIEQGKQLAPALFGAVRQLEAVEDPALRGCGGEHPFEKLGDEARILPPLFVELDRAAAELLPQLRALAEGVTIRGSNVAAAPLRAPHFLEARPCLDVVGPCERARNRAGKRRRLPSTFARAGIGSPLATPRDHRAQNRRSRCTPQEPKRRGRSEQRRT